MMTTTDTRTKTSNTQPTHDRQWNETIDWDALDFYKKLGYHMEFERHGFEKDSVFYFLRKDY